MVEQNYNNVITEVFSELGNPERNIALVNYVNDIVVLDLPVVTELLSNQDVCFVINELSSKGIYGAYEPFLDVICSAHRKRGKNSFVEFMESCGVYPQYIPILASYYDTGLCQPGENILLQEVESCQRVMDDSIYAMLARLVEDYPIFIVIDRVQYISNSSLRLLRHIVCHPMANFGIVLGINGRLGRRERINACWNLVSDTLVERGMSFYIGAGVRNSHAAILGREVGRRDWERQIYNQFYLLDYEEAYRQAHMIEGNASLDDAENRCSNITFHIIYAKTALLLGELSKALEILAQVRLALKPEDVVHWGELTYVEAQCHMYKGSLDRAAELAEEAYTYAKQTNSSSRILAAEVLRLQVQMSGWHNIFFIRQNIDVSEDLLRRLYKAEWYNHLAYILIYAFNNGTDELIAAYSGSSRLSYYDEGLKIAQDLGNRVLTYNAYQKYIMMASTDGLNDIALSYVLKCNEYFKPQGDINEGRDYASLGYGLSALGEHALAERIYDQALRVFCSVKSIDDIAEIYYNHSMNHIMMGRFDKADADLQLAIKIIIRMQLNGLRVCNTSKIYGLSALVDIIQGNRFNCERNLQSAKRFLNAYLERGTGDIDVESLHDYSNMSDEMFLYHLATALLLEFDGEIVLAEEHLVQSEAYFKKAQGNMYYLRQILEGAMQRISRRRESSSQAITHRKLSDDLLMQIESIASHSFEAVSEREVLDLLNGRSIKKSCDNLWVQVDFLSRWQKVLDEAEGNLWEIADSLMSLFVNRYSFDGGVYIYWLEGEGVVLFNNTKAVIDFDNLSLIHRIADDYPEGFAACCTQDNFYEYSELMDIFQMDNIFSFAMVPFKGGGNLTSMFIGYINMKENMHSAVERYALDDTDLSFYTMILRELEYTMARREHTDKIRRMNDKLRKAAITDVLTGIYNRNGLFETANAWVKEAWSKGEGLDLAVMFIDLDNFKGYNDRFGHDVGDLILRSMADVFVTVVDGLGFAARSGGDEFIILLKTNNREILESSAKRIYELVDGCDGFKTDIEKCIGHEITVDKTSRITASIGIAFRENIRSEAELDALIKQADDGMYMVKEAGKGHYKFVC